MGQVMGAQALLPGVPRRAEVDTPVHVLVVAEAREQSQGECRTRSQAREMDGQGKDGSRRGNPRERRREDGRRSAVMAPVERRDEGP